MKKNLIFLHLPKCGGTTFQKILNEIYPEEEIFDITVIDNMRLNTNEFKSLNIDERAKIKLLKGHLDYGLHEYLIGPSEYITFMRNPIERILSYYYYVKARPHHRLFKMGLFNENTSLYDFVTKINQRDIHNGQIRLLSGIGDTEENMLVKARENIENHFSFVGTIERFDEGLFLLSKKFDWPSFHYTIKNKTFGRPKMDQIDKKTLDAIHELNGGDISLYNEISQKLEKKIEQTKMFKTRYKIFKMKQIALEKKKSLIKRIK